MPPIRQYSNWNKRSTNTKKKLNLIEDITLFVRVKILNFGILKNL